MTFFWYTLAGGIATSVHYAVLLIGVEVFGFSAAPLAAVGALCGAMVSYLVNRRITFSSTTVRHLNAIARFMLIAACGAVLNGCIVWAGVFLLAWHYLAAQAVATIVVMGLTYRVNRYWTFAL